MPRESISTEIGRLGTLDHPLPYQRLLLLHQRLRSGQTRAVAGSLDYRVIDRSLLLPYYKRFLVEPSLRFIPAAIHPNTLTHVGHLVNLGGLVVLLSLRPYKGWPFIFAALMVQLYCWFDNVDGGHARRTKQTSVLGEFLDHGLDMFNVSYVAMLTSIGLGSSPLMWLTIAVVIPTAAVLTYWEQAQTGTMRLGLLNQVESLLVLGTVLTLSGLFGADFFVRTEVFGVSLRTAMSVWVCTTIVFGELQNTLRVVRHEGSLKSAMPALPLLAFEAAVIGAMASGALQLIPAVVASMAVVLFAGMRFLVHRIREEAPAIDLSVSAITGVFAVLSFLQLGGVAISAKVGWGLATLSVVVFGVQLIGDIRDALNLIAKMEEARRIQRELKAAA